MNSKLTYEKIKINKTIYNKNLEQQIDFEYQLPDYYTGIFKVLQFNLEPHISSCRAANNQFIIDGVAVAKLLYIDEEGGNLKSLQQNIPFSKTVDLKNANDESILFYSVKTNYKNCKIISPKKIDIKATLIVSVKVQSQEEENILKNSEDNTLQLRCIPVAITSNQIWTTQQFNINEQVELNSIAKEILDVKIKISDDECKIISNKVISKAIAQIEILYCADEKNTPILEKASIPINNIIDMPKINEKFLYNISYDVISTNFEISQETKAIKIEADVLINSYANLCEKIDVVIDSFSTKYELNCTKKELNSSTIVSLIDENITTEEKIADINLLKIFHIDMNITDLTNSQRDEKIEFKAKLNLNILGSNDEESIKTYTKSIPIEFKVDKKNIEFDYINFNVNCVNILDIDYNLNDDGTLKIKVKFNLKGFVFTSGNISTITDITFDESKIKKKPKAALTLYYPAIGDKVWKIAKHFCTSPRAIVEANDLQSEVIESETMLIIPII